MIPCRDDGASNFSDGFARVVRNGKYGFIDKTGKQVVPRLYDHVEYWSDMDIFVAVVNGTDDACIRYYYDGKGALLGRGKVQRFAYKNNYKFVFNN